MGPLATTVGFIAGSLTTGAYLPQVWKTYKTKSGEGLSFLMLLTLALGLSLWAIYGVMSRSLPLMVTNIVALALILALLGMKFKFDSAPTRD